MKKNKKIICLLVTLITLCASSLTVYASEITESGAENNEQENMYSFNDYVYDDEGNIIINAFGYFPEGSTNQSCAYSVRGSYPIKELVSGVTDFENTYPLIYKNWYTASNGEKIYYFVWAVAKNNNGKIGLYTFNMKGTIATADSDNVNNGKTGAYFPTDTLNGKTLNANIPIFENIEDAEKYESVWGNSLYTPCDWL